MMHHPNVHHQAMSGHPNGQHIQSHQGLPGHHQLQPHQMHGENRLATGHNQVGGGMTNVSQSMSNMGAPMTVAPPHHGPTRQIAPHTMRAPLHHPPAHHAIQQQPRMKTLQRPFTGGMMQQPYQQQNMPHTMHRNQPRMLINQQRQSHLQSQHNQMQSHHIPPHPANTINPPHTTSLVHGSQAQNTPTQTINVSSNPSPPQNLIPTSQTLQQRPPQPPAHGPQAQVHIQSQQKQAHQQSQNSLASVNAQPQQTKKTLSQTSPTAVPNDGGTAEGVVGKDSEILPSSPSPTNLANSKEKTPMCLVNELARFNKIKHQYRLTSETGPPHQKVFTVTLRLGDSEEYTAQGTSIKRAQHAAAREALKQTSRPSPPPKQRPDGRHTRTTTNNTKNATGPVMPTVELNALAMKICEPAVYTPVQSVPRMLPPSRPQPFRMQPALVRYPRYRPMYPNGFNNRFQPGFRPPYQLIDPAPMLYRVQLAVGARCYQGEGATPQAARHDAAAKALAELKLAQPEEGRTTEVVAADDTAEPAADGDGGGEESDADLLNLDVKSPVSLVHELALKLNLTVTFGVKFEKGPPHMKVFITTCTVGDLETEGEGNGKKVSKKRAAEKMLAEMRKLWPPVVFRSRVSQFKTQQRVKRKHQLPKRKTRNLIKENTDPTASSDDPTATDATAANPISILAQARQAARARSPQYRLLEERRANNTRKFVVECTAGETRALGAGPNKKAAKRNAAENVLTALGINTTNNASTTSPDNEPATSPKLADCTKPRKVTFSEANVSEGNSGGSAGRQLVPGLLLMQENYNSSQQFNTTKSGENTQTTAMITIAKELLRAGSSPTAEAIENQETSHKAIGGTATVTTQASAPSVPSGAITSPAKTPSGGQVGRPKEQLMYLAQLLGFQVQFTDFPKGNHREFLSLVSLSTDPPMTCHGGGSSTEASHDQAARAALEMIAHMGLDNVAAQPHGDGIHVVPGGVCTKPGLLSNGVKQ